MTHLSIRQRLTLWNSSVLALVLSCFAAAGWLTLTEALDRRAAATVRESARAVAGAIRAGQQALLERGEVEKERGATEEAVLREFRAGDLDIFVADEAEQVMAARKPRPVEATVEVAGDATAAPSGEAATMPAAVRALIETARDDGTLRALADTGVLVGALTLDSAPARAALLRLVPSPQMVGEPTLLIVAVRSSADDVQLLRQVRTTLLLAIPLALLASLVAGFALARRSLAPLEAINARTSRITAANLDERLPVDNPPDELGRLATIINGLLGRVGDAFRTQRQFVADASHELRTPIAVIRGEAEVTLRRAIRTEEEYREALKVIQDESVRLTRIVDDLFLLARVDAGGVGSASQAVDVEELVHDAVRSLRSLAEARGLQCVAEPSAAASAPARVSGDPALLRRLLVNLLDNAIKHTPAGGTVTVAYAAAAGTVRVQVRDDGPGIPPALRARIFQRFVHGVASTAAPERTGAGLGLAIAEAIAHAHRGRLALLETPRGATFELLLPTIPPSGDSAP
ncbi:MAG: HAMP domain-containing protein [Gemmatimonadetes bacterium]|nr:HAMP domain-containing protein [Gemmatimonadota bacterium]